MRSSFIRTRSTSLLCLVCVCALMWVRVRLSVGSHQSENCSDANHSFFSSHLLLTHTIYCHLCLVSVCVAVCLCGIASVRGQNGNCLDANHTFPSSSTLITRFLSSRPRFTALFRHCMCRLGERGTRSEKEERSRGERRRREGMRNILS